MALAPIERNQSETRQNQIGNSNPGIQPSSTPISPQPAIQSDAVRQTGFISPNANTEDINLYGAELLRLESGLQSQHARSAQPAQTAYIQDVDSWFAEFRVRESQLPVPDRSTQSPVAQPALTSDAGSQRRRNQGAAAARSGRIMQIPV